MSIDQKLSANRKKWIELSLLVSVVLHVAVLVVLQFAPRLRSQNRADAAAQEALKNTVEFFEPISQSAKGRPSAADRTHESRERALRQNTRRARDHRANPHTVPDTQMTAHDLELPSNGDIDINPSFRPVAPEQVEGIDVGPGKEQASEADGVPHDDPTAEWGSGGRDFSRVADLGRFDRLYDLIDSHIMYPGVLARHGIQGTVNARLIVTPQGRCDWRHTQISSTQAHLRLYILDALMSVCRQDLVRYARKNENSNFDLSFQFSITEHNEKQLIDQQRKVVGNVFLFYRNSQQSALEWHLGPFRGMFPIPYVALDFAWLQENYDKVVNSRDPLRDFKDHLNQDEPSSEN